MCEHLGEAAASSRLMSAIAKVAQANKVVTRDLGGDASTENVTDAIINAVRRDDLDLEIFNKLGK